MKQTLCWECANAVPNLHGTRGCSWSKKFVPVKGWTAKEIKSDNVRYRQNSFLVLKCPKFMKG